MGNKGRIVVFISLMTMAFMILISFAVCVVVQSVAASKADITGFYATENIKSYYNSYIFEQYHILLFDRNANGKGEGYWEEMVKKYCQSNLGKGYKNIEVASTQYMLLMENDCEAFRSQVQDVMDDAIAKRIVRVGADRIRGITNGKDGSLSQEEEMEFDVQTEETDGTSKDEEMSHPISEESDSDLAQDPREITEKMSSQGILLYVLPDGQTLSQKEIQSQNLPSVRNGKKEDDYVEPDRKFQEKNRLKQDVTGFGKWAKELEDQALLTAYGQWVFSSFNDSKGHETVLEYEQEYLIAGHKRDEDNLKSVVHQIIGIRLPLNYMSLRKDPQKQQQILSLATSIAGIFPEAIPVLKLLLTGAWSYIESVVDAKALLAGKRVAFLKDATTWKTELASLSDSMQKEPRDDPKGITYSEYLIILMSLHGEKLPYRMLDLMQVNTQIKQPQFYMKDAAVGFGVDVQSEYLGTTYYQHYETKY
ncbi:MAG: DUF5702 domain-containing protein [Wujia sp.]